LATYVKRGGQGGIEEIGANQSDAALLRTGTAAIPNRAGEYPSGAAAQQAHAVREVALLYPNWINGIFSAEKGIFRRTEQEHRCRWEIFACLK